VLMLNTLDLMYPWLLKAYHRIFKKIDDWYHLILSPLLKNKFSRVEIFFLV
jgi:hypothetical protein